MALDLTVLTPIEPGGARMSGAPVIFTYTTADTIGAVTAAGYFNNATRQLEVGDMIFANINTGSARALYALLVNANDGTTVDVADGVILGLTDSA